MLSRDELVGTITIYKLEAKPFTEKQITLVETFADQALIAIENARLFNETNEALEYQTATSEVLSVVSRSLGQVDQAFDIILESACELCDAEYGHLLLVDNDLWTAAALRNVPPAYAAFCVRHPYKLDRRHYSDEFAFPASLTSTRMAASETLTAQAVCSASRRSSLVRRARCSACPSLGMAA